MTRKKTSRKCIPLKNKWCEPMKLFGQVGDPDASGLNIATCINTKNHSRGYGALLRFSYRQKKDHGYNYIWLNFCPWCGADISDRTSPIGKLKK